jgi:DNA-binding NtrC family response regulator
MDEGRGKLLVVDDDRAVLDFLAEALTELRYQVTPLSSPQRALEEIERHEYHALISDVQMPELRGIDLLSAVRQRQPDLPVILITAFGSIEMAIEAVRAGASDFVTKPFKIDVLALSIDRALRGSRMRGEIARLRRIASEAGPVVAESATTRRVLDMCRKAARSDATVLLTGESGSGKGAMARFIHQASDRRSNRFLQVNCAALPLQLVESELFGVKRGAYTDARESRDGLFVEASGGTLLLDEIGEMPLEAQAKLLHVLETSRVRPIGGSETQVDVRVIAATNRSLEDAIRARQFREDLYFRLNVIPIDVPPLRERREDIPPLVDLLVQRASTRLGKPVSVVAGEAMAWLMRQDWPGNVRELSNAIERAIALGEGDVVSLDDLTTTSRSDLVRDLVADAASRELTLAEMELVYIRRIVERCDGNLSRAARVLDIDRRTLYRRLEAMDEPAGPDLAAPPFADKRR